jgi:hypothetical protein
MFEPKIPYLEFRQPDLDFEDKYGRAGNCTKENSTRNESWYKEAVTTNVTCCIGIQKLNFAVHNRFSYYKFNLQFQSVLEILLNSTIAHCRIECRRTSLGAESSYKKF